MRNMSFAMTTEQIRSRAKTCTRRLGWLFAKIGDVVQPVVKGQGLKKGEHVEYINGPIRFTKVRREPLWWITRADIVWEGFQGMAWDEFIAMFCKANRCGPQTCVTAIYFEYVGEKT